MTPWLAHALVLCACTHPHVRYVDAASPPDVAHRAVIEAASRIGMVEASAPEPADAAERASTYVIAGPQLVTRLVIRTYRSGAGSRVELAANSSDLLDDLPIDLPTVTYLGGVIADPRARWWIEPHVRVGARWAGELSGGYVDATVELSRWLWMRDDAGVAHRRRHRVGAILGAGPSVVLTGGEGDDAEAEPALRATVGLFYDRNCVVNPVPARDLVARQRGVVSASVGVLLGDIRSFDVEVGAAVAPLVGAFARVGYQSAPDAAATATIGVDLGRDGLRSVGRGLLLAGLTLAALTVVLWSQRNADEPTTLR